MVAKDDGERRKRPSKVHDRMPAALLERRSFGFQVGTSGKGKPTTYGTGKPPVGKAK